MRKCVLISVTSMLIMICSVVITRTAMAATTSCWTLEAGHCAKSVRCTDKCTPNCNLDAIAPYYTDNCKCVSSGTYNCLNHSTDRVNCYVKYHCAVGTATCPTDPSEKVCTNTQGTQFTNEKKVLSGSGCTVTP